MKLPLKSVRLKDSTTICGKSGSQFEGKDGLTLTADTELGAVVVEREAYDAVFVPLANVAHFTPLAQKQAAKK